MIYVWAPLLFILTDAQFISSPASTFSKCSESELDLPWTYSVATNNAASVKWKKDGLTMLTWTVPINNYGHENGYNSSKIVHKSNGNVVIKTLSPTDAGVYTCEVTYAVTGNSIQSTGVTLEISSCPTSEMSTYLATERTTSVNSIFEFRNITIPMITGIITPTSDISASTTSFLNTGTIKANAHIEATNLYSNTETTHLYTQTETTTSYANTETINSNEIQTKTLRIVSNYMSIYHSMFVTTATNDISGSFETTSQIMNETFELPGFSISSYNEIILPSTFETSNDFPETFSETSISLSVDTLSDNLFNTLHVSSGSLITTNSSQYSIFSMTVSQSYVGDSYIASLNTLFSVPILTSDTTGSDFEIINESRVNTFSLKTEAVQTPITTATVDSSTINTVLNSNKSDSLLFSISGNTSRIQPIITNTESPLTSTTFIDQISYSSKMEDPSFLSFHNLSETTETLQKISVNSQLPSAIVNTMNIFLYTTNSLIKSYLDDTRLSFYDFTDVFQTFSQDHDASASTSLANFFQLTDHHLSLQTTEYYEAMQTEFTSYVTKSLNESHTDNAATGIYSKEIVTSGNFGTSYMHTGVMPSQTQLASLNDIQDSTTNFQSTYFEPYSQSNDEGFSSEISQNLLSTLQSTSLLLSFNTQASASEVDSYMETTNMLTFESQSGIQTKDLSLFTNPSSIQISTVLIDFKPTLLTTTNNFNSKTIPSMIKPSSKQISSGISYIEIETSFKDSLFSFDYFSGSVTSNDQDMTSFSSRVYQSKKTLSTNTIQGGLSEKNKTLIFITTTSAVIAMIVVILLIIFAKVYMSKNIMKPREEDNNMSWSNNSIPPKAAFPDYSFTGKSIYPLLNTSSVSFTMFPYEHHWNDIV